MMQTIAKFLKVVDDKDLQTAKPMNKLQAKTLASQLTAQSSSIQTTRQFNK